MSNNISSLFENLMAYNDSHSKKHIKRKTEADQTLLNLSVELPDNIIDDIEPEDVKVDVGVMNVDTDDVDEIDVDTDEDDINDQDTDVDSEDDIDDEEDTDAKESFSFKNRKDLKLEPKCNECNKKEENSLDDAKANIRRRVKTNEAAKTRKEKKNCKESLMHLDTRSLNKLITDFVRENYKNIDKVVITKAILENRQLTLKGYIQDKKGLKESIVLSNRGFDPKKLENTKFLIDFKDMNKTFGVIKESLKQPFTFTATMKNGIVKFENLKCNFKTRVNENTLARITGNYLYESRRIKKEDLNSDFQNYQTDLVNKYKKYAKGVETTKTAHSVKFKFDKKGDIKDVQKFVDALIKDGFKFMKDQSNSKVKTNLKAGTVYPNCNLIFDKEDGDRLFYATVRDDIPNDRFVAISLEK